MADYRYAFEILDDPEKRIMRLTADEFELLFEPHPDAARKALAYSEFRLGGKRLCRVPNELPPS